jgi:tetratricopeptide (TPR) repeat protein
MDQVEHTAKDLFINFKKKEESDRQEYARHTLPGMRAMDTESCFENEWTHFQSTLYQGFDAIIDAIDCDASEVQKNSFYQLLTSLSALSVKDPLEIHASICSLLELIHDMGLKLLQSKQYEKAQTLFQLLTSLTEKNMSAWLGLGAAYRELDLYEMALKAYDRAEEIDPYEPSHLIYSAECLQRIHQPAKALEKIQKARDAIHNHPDKPRWMDALEKIT